MILLLVSFFVLGLNSVFTQVVLPPTGIEFKLQLIEANKWGVFARPNGVFPTTDNTIIGSGQVTVVLPVGYAVSPLTNVNGNWTATTPINGPIENPTRRYQSYGFNNEVPMVQWKAGTETLLFTFNGNGTCPDSLYLIDNETDPFNVLPNSEGNNPGNEITIFDMVTGDVYEYMGNYSQSAWSCNDCDGDGILNAFEDTDGDGQWDAFIEDLNANGTIDYDEDLDNDGFLDPGEDRDGDGLLDLVNEDVDGDGYLDPDVSQVCNPCDPYHTESAYLELVTGFDAICANDLGDTACFKVHIDGHWPPYDVEWTDGVDTFTTVNLDSADIVCYVPDSSVSIQILSIVDSFGCVLDTALGAPIDIEVHGPISIDDDPDDVVECFGNGTSFCIDTLNLGDGQIFTQWQVNTGSGWVDINDGAVYDDTDSLCLEVVNVAGKHNWQYRAKIFTSVCDTVFSTEATLRVEGPITYSAHPVDFTNCATETASFSATPVNSGAVGTMVYQWEYSTDGTVWSPVTATILGTNFAGFNTATTLNLSSLTIALDGYYFRLRTSTGECSFVYSNAARLNVEGAITVIDDPDNISNCAGNEVYFVADFNNAGATYPADPNLTLTDHYWQVNTGSGWTNVDGSSGVYSGTNGSNTGASGDPVLSDNDTLTITNVVGLDGYQYRICYTSPTCSTPVCSSPATLEVSGNVAFSVDPADATLCSGGDTTFFATAAIPQGDFTFGWEYSDPPYATWTPITFPDANFSHSITGAVASGTDILTITNVAGMYGRRFRAVANATDCGTVYSDYAVLSVQGPLSVADQPDPITECYGNATSFSATIANPGVVGSTIVHWQISLDNGASWQDLPTNQPTLYSGVTSISNSTGVATLAIPNVAVPGHDALFRISYRTSTCTVQYSNSARLTVEGPITVTDQPDDVDLCAGDAASFTSTGDVGTAGTFTYRWQISTDGISFNDITGITDGGVYTGFNTTTLNVINSTGLYSRCYRLSYSTGECNRVYSDRACLNIDGPLSFAAHPQDIVQCSGEAVLFGAVAVTGSLEADSLTQIQYNWQESTDGGTTWADLSNDSLYNGVNTDTMSISYTTDLDSNGYRLKIWTDNCDTIFSDPAFIDVEGPITVTDEPDNITECSGSGVSFSATVALQNGDPGTLMYQWEYSTNGGNTWNNVPTILADVYTGETTTTLSISDVAGMGSWRFRMRYRTPTCDAAWTNYAVLTVEGPISVTNHPDHRTICSGSATNFGIHTLNPGQGNITYQWQVCTSGDSLVGPWSNVPNNSIYNGAQTANLSVSDVIGKDGFYFRCLIQTSECSSISSYAAILRVEGPIGFGDHPDDITQCSGEGVQFIARDTIAAGNSGTLVRQWQVSSDGISYFDITAAGVNGYSGWDSDTLTIANVVGLNGRKFRIAVNSGVCNEIYSFPATLYVEGPLTISAQPADFTNCSDKEAYFFSQITNPALGGPEAVFKQWQYSPDNGVTWVNITQLVDTLNGHTINFGGYDSDSLLISPIIGLNNYLFRNIFWTETCNRDTTNEARLTVEGPISFTDQPDDVTTCSGEPTCFTIAIANSTGQGVISYQWQRWTVGGWVDLSNSLPYSGVFTNQLCISDVAGLYNARYRCGVRTANCDWDFSDQANLFVEGPITFNLQPVNASICSNRPHLFNTTITNPGYGQMTFRWQYRPPSGAWAQFATNIGNMFSIGVTNPTDPNAQWQGAFGQDLNLTNIDGLNGYQFRLVVIMPNCGDTTNTVTLTVRDKCLAADCDLDNDGTNNGVDTDDDNDQLADYWEAWMTTNNLITAVDTFVGTGPWYYTVLGTTNPTLDTTVTVDRYIRYNRCLVDTDGDGLFDNQEDPDEDNIQNGEETDGDLVFDGNPLDPCSPVLGPTCIGINLAIKVRLQGAKITPSTSSDPFMRSTLRAYNPGTSNPNGTRLIPTHEPYEDMAAFEHKNTGPNGDGGGDEVVIDSTTVFAVSDSNAIVDWVFVELRSSTALDSVATTRAALLQRDGDVVETDGTSHLRFPSANAGTYYVAVRHRNHLGVMTGEALDLSPALQEIDFTDPSFITNGNSAQIQLGTKMYMWAGDLNSDGRTIYQGPGNDILKLFTTVLYDPANVDLIANFISQGYLVADVNLDGRAIYQGPANDRSLLLLNTILKHPQNVNLISNYVILEQLP
jgi:hypothetical protein